MHHSLKIKILDLDHLESIFEQNITDVDAEKIVGGTLSLSGSQLVFANNVGSTLSLSGSQLVFANSVGSTLSLSFFDERCMPDEPIPPSPEPGWIPQCQLWSNGIVSSNFNSQLDIGFVSGF